MTAVKEEMTRKVAFVTEDDELVHAHDSMRALEIRHVPVLRAGKLVGMLSDRDVLLHSTPKGAKLGIPKKKVHEVMRAGVVTCAPNTSIRRAADIMLQNRIHCLPVTDSKEALVGVITATDLLRLLRDGEWGPDTMLPFTFERPRHLMVLTNE